MPRLKRRRNGPHVVSDDPLVLFLYILMRDHLTPGYVEQIMEGHVEKRLPASFTNGHLAQYAEHLAKRLR